MTDNLSKWVWVIAFIAVPLFFTHLFPDSYIPRLAAILWVYTLAPLIIFLLALFTHQTIKFKNYSNPAVEKKLSLIARGGGVVLSVFFVIHFTFPILNGTYNLYILHKPLEVIEDSVGNQSIAVLAPGLYFGLTLDHDQNNSYAYYFPTIFRFGNSKFRFSILPGTHFVLDVKPL